MANTIQYKGYIGSIEYSREDKLFFGKIELIDDLVTFEADSASELEINFAKVVDEYLQTCKGVFNVRIDPKLHQKIHKEALKAGVSLNAFIQNVLTSKVAAVQN